MLIPLSLLLLGALALLAHHWSRRRLRKNLLLSELSAPQRAIINASVPLIRELPARLHRAFEGKIALFLHQIEFIGCDGLAVTEEMRLSIAAQACLLVVNTDSWYVNLRTVLVYPGAFKSRRAEHNGYVVTERETVRTGESWARGPVILSWADARQGALNETDGHNVVFHEFAHQLDDLSGYTDGIPVLGKGQSFAQWERVFVSAYKTHCQKVETGQWSVFDPYGATAPQEFFAVAVETFFERPVELQREEAGVYRQLASLFQLDPASWS